MNRLFIHLFVVIIVGLLSINWLSEYLWQQWRPPQTKEHQILAQTLTVLSEQAVSNHQTLSELQQKLPYPLNTIKYKDVAWLENQKQALKEKRYIIGYDANDYLIIYIQTNSNDDIYVFGPIKQHLESKNMHAIKFALLLFSYLLLALIIFLWSKPLWQDLTQLNNMAAKISQGKFNIEPVVNKHSPIGNIVTTFNLMAQRIIKLISDQRELVNAVSHELRTPLSRLKFSIEMLENTSIEQRMEMSQDITEMSALIDEMLSYARLENLDAQTSKDNVNMISLLQNTIEKLTRSSSIKVNCNLPKNCTFICNENMIERAIQNLLSNALRYANQQVNVVLSYNDKQLLLSVEDDGEGIEETEKKKVFDAFYRIEKSRNKELGGFGLGLAIVNRICLWHSGYCQLDDSPTGGCKFTLCLPIQN